MGVASSWLPFAPSFAQSDWLLLVPWPSAVSFAVRSADSSVLGSKLKTSTDIPQD